MVPEQQTFLQLNPEQRMLLKVFADGRKAAPANKAAKDACLELHAVGALSIILSRREVAFRITQDGLSALKVGGRRG